jgi:alkylation response protein AidB-like acyl-CoA dehydrogenase
MKYANATTLEYLKTRRQFGVPIGSFQALQHRLVDMYIRAEQARSITLLACSRVDAAGRGAITAAERMRAVSAAKLNICDAVRHVGQEAIQLHGGMGMTQEMKVAHTFKRLTMLGQQFGDADYHLDRYAALT